MVGPRQGRGNHGGEIARSPAHHSGQPKQAAAEKARYREVAAGKPRASAASRGRRARHGRGGARGLCARGAHAAHRHSRHQRSAGDLRSRRARAALGRHHQGRRRTSRRASRRCSSMPRAAAASGLGVRQDFFDLRALARNAGDLLAGRAAAKGLQSSVDISEKLPAFVDRRSRAAARGAGKPDRQCGQVHRAGRRRADGRRRCAAPKGKVGVAFAVSDSGIGLTLAEIKRLFRPFSQANVGIAVALRRRRARAVVGAGRSRARWAATSSWRSGAAAAPPSR